MKTKKIKIAGKEVVMAYCYATEIMYSNFEDDELTSFIVRALKNEKTKKISVVHAILASAMAYYEEKDEETPITDKDLIFQAESDELSAAITTLIQLYSEWYKLPSGESEKTKKTKKGAPSKN